MRLSLYLVAVLLLGHSSRALAQEQASVESVRALASAHVVRGTEFYRQKAFAAALLEFQRAYAIDPDYRLLYDIGQAKRELADFVGAAQSFERFIVEARRGEPAGRAAIHAEAKSATGPAVSITVTFHRLEVDAATLQKLAELSDGEDGNRLKLVLEQLRARENPPSNSGAPHESTPPQAAEPTVIADSRAAPAAYRTRVARGLDYSDPYSVP